MPKIDKYGENRLKRTKKMKKNGGKKHRKIKYLKNGEEST